MLIETIIFALIISLLKRGKISNLGELKIRGTFLALAAFGMQAVLDWVHAPGLLPGTRGLGQALHIFSYILLLSFTFINRNLSGMGLISLGIFLNGLVIASNGGFMPVDPTFLPEAKQEMLRQVQGTHGLLLPTTKLSFLADSIFVSIPGLGEQLISIGDIVIDIGMFIFILKATLPKRTPFSN